MKEHDKDDFGEYNKEQKFTFPNYPFFSHRAQFMKEIRMLKEKGKPDGVKERTDGLVAAMKIQKVWRGFATRRITRRRKMEEMFLIGMVPRPNQKNFALYEEMEKVQEFTFILIHSLNF